MDATLCHDRSVNAAERVLQQMHEAGLRLQVGKVLDAETLDGGDGVDGFHQLCSKSALLSMIPRWYFRFSRLNPQKISRKSGADASVTRASSHEYTNIRPTEKSRIIMFTTKSSDTLLMKFRFSPHRHTRDDLTHTHRVKELLRECQQVLVISQYQGGIDALSGLQCQDALHGSDKGAENQDDNHHHAHQVEQVDVSVH